MLKMSTFETLSFFAYVKNFIATTESQQQKVDQIRLDHKTDMFFLIFSLFIISQYSGLQ